MLTPGEGNLASYFRERDLNVWAKRVETRRRKYPGLHTVQSFILARQLRKRNVDAVICNTFPAASRVGTACGIAGIPYGIYVREYISNARIHREILGKADRIFAESRDVMHYLSRMTSPANIDVAYDFIDATPILQRVDRHRATGRRLVPFESVHPIVGLVGRITKYKQPDVFIRAIPEILSTVPEARFVVVGGASASEKEYESWLKDLASRTGVRDQVAFMGHREDAVEIMSEFQLACLTSKREPLGRVVLEAQLMGCPVVAPEAGGSAELVEDGVTGLQFSSTSPDSDRQLAIQIIRLLEDSQLRSSLAARARKWAYRTFASLEHVRRLEIQFEQLSTPAA
jgi:glycosyltransferase involved in cell wall biosynthesis